MFGFVNQILWFEGSWIGSRGVLRGSTRYPRVSTPT